MKAREYLVEKGLAKAGARGRFSREGKAALIEAVANGVVFDDWPKEEITVVHKGKSVDVKAAVEKPIDSEYLFPSEFLYPETDYRAMAGKTEYGMREVCNNCRVSLVMCSCGSPTILGSIVVTIERR